MVFLMLLISPFIGSKNWHCIHFWGRRWVFSVATPQTWSDLDETWNISDGHNVHSHKKLGQIIPGVSKGAKTWFVSNQRSFQPLILHWFRPFLKQKMWIHVHMCTPLKNFSISVQGVFQAPKIAKRDNLEGVLVVGVQLKWHNFGQRKSFWGLVNIPSEFWWGT